MKHLYYCILLIISPLINAQNDPFGVCDGYITNIDLTFKIPNPDFELFTCCPSSFSQMHCVNDWIQPSTPTPDYMHTCGFVFPAAIAAGLVPFPSGNGIVGTIFAAGWQEYVAVCLIEPLDPGESFTVNFHLAYTPIDNFGGVCNAPPHSPIDIVVYGHPDCGSMNVNTVGCPMNVDPEWIILGQVNYSPVSEWIEMSIDIETDRSIGAIMIGSPCILPFDYTLGGCMAYFYFDNFRLEEIVFNKKVELYTTGHPCSDDYKIFASVDTFGGEWQWFLEGGELFGETSDVLAISANGYPSGIYSARYVLDGYCIVSEIVIDLTISDAPDPVICPPFVSLCITSDPIYLVEGNPPGGDFSGDGVVGSQFYPGLAGVGMHTITYTAYSINQCPASCISFIEVQDLITVTCPDEINFCSFEGVIILEGAYPPGGVFQGPGANGFAFDPEEAGYGVHTIRYIYTDRECENECEFMINVHMLPAPKCPADMTVCMEQGEIEIPQTNMPGGVFYGAGVTDPNFDPNKAGIGNHLIEYLVTDHNFCEGGCGFIITVIEGIVPVCPPNMTVCSEKDPFLLTGGTPSNGTYFGLGIQNNIFNPLTAGIGIHDVEFTIPSSECKDTCTFKISVIGTRPANCPTIDDICIDAAEILLPDATPEGGIYSGSGVSQGNFNPGIAGIGNHIITYDLLDNEGCRFRCTSEVRVWALPQINVPNNITVCADVSPFTLTGATPTGGSYSGNGVVGAQFNPATAGIGVHTIQYSYTDGFGCQSSASYEIEVLFKGGAGPDADLICFKADTAYISASGTGVWRLAAGNPGQAIIENTGSSSTKVFDFTVAGVYVLIWETSGQCVDSIEIRAGDDCRCIVRNNFIQTGTTLFCGTINGHLIVGAEPTPIGGTYTWEWSTDGVNFTPAPGDIVSRDYVSGQLNPGVYFFRRIYETTTPEECYSISNVLRLEIVAEVNAGTQILFPELCVGETQVISLRNLLNGADIGGVWREISVVPTQGMGFDAATGTFRSAGQIAGTYFFRYFMQGTVPCESDSSQVRIVIHNLPNVSILVEPGEVLDCAITGITLRMQSNASNPMITWYLDGNPINTIPDILVEESGIYRLVVIDGVTGCSSESSVFIRDDSDYPFVYIQDPAILTCAVTSVTLDGSVSQTNSRIIHEWSNSSGMIIATGVLSLLVNQPGMYTLRSRDTINDCTNSYTVEVFVNRVLPVVDAGDRQLLYCSNEHTSLLGTATTQSGLMEILWTSQAGTVLSGSNTFNPEVKGEGYYYLVIRDPVNGCINRDSVRIDTTNETFIITRVEAPEICFEEQTGYIIVESAGQAPFKYYINGQYVGTSTRLDGLKPGRYRIRIEDSLGCEAEVVVDLIRREAVRVEFPIRIVIEQGDSTWLEPIFNRTIAEIKRAQWNPRTEMSCDTCLITQVWPDQTRIYGILVEDIWGCEGTGSVEILVKRKIRVFIPGAFTPNGDGINDGFTLYSPDIREIMSMEIFDRWGNRVFEKQAFPPNEPGDGWDGSFHKQEMVPAVFAFVAYVELHTGERLVYSGEVQLLR
jgi:gliding motility-associated-like protein